MGHPRKTSRGRERSRVIAIGPDNLNLESRLPGSVDNPPYPPSHSQADSWCLELPLRGLVLCNLLLDPPCCPHLRALLLRHRVLLGKLLISGWTGLPHAYYPLFISL